jgi:hypothetical protein
MLHGDLVFEVYTENLSSVMLRVTLSSFPVHCTDFMDRTLKCLPPGISGEHKSML